MFYRECGSFEGEKNMTVQEILDLEKTNSSDIILLKEGMFIRAYNSSAMRLSTKVKTLKVNTKFIKLVGQTVMYCGFPEKLLPQLRIQCVEKKYGWREHGEKRVDILGVAMPGEDYEAWVKDVLSKAETPNVTAKKEINDFPGVPVGDQHVERAEKLKTLAPVIEKHYDLIKWMIPKISQFPRDQRFLLADRIEKYLLDILELLLAAMYSPRRKEYLLEVNHKIDLIRLLTRLAKDLKYVSVKAYDYVCQQFFEIGCMVGGWLKQS